MALKEDINKRYPRGGITVPPPKPTTGHGLKSQSDRIGELEARLTALETAKPKTKRKTKK